MNLPNRISISRIALIPLFVVIYMLDKYIPYAQLIGAAIFTLAMATDAIDGTIARKHNLVTTLGKFLDSIADKALVTAGLFMLVYARIGFEPWTTVFCTIIMIRELIISFFRQVAAGENLIMQADKFGKIKAVFQDISLPLFLACADLKILFGLESDIIMIISFALFAAATLLTIMSAVNYIVKHRHVFAGLEAKDKAAAEAAKASAMGIKSDESEKSTEGSDTTEKGE